jgi:hypothetical protein
MIYRHAAIATLCVALCGMAAGPTTAAPTGNATVQIQHGINTFVEYNCEDAAQWSLFATNQMQQFKSLGANSVAIAFPLYTSSVTSNLVFGKDVCGDSSYQTPPPSQLSSIVASAHQSGLAVLLRPLIDETNLRAQSPTAWRGVLKPTKPAAWFNNYWNALQPYLRVAQLGHVQRFAVSTELDSLASAPEWRAIVRKAMNVFHGQLVFSASWKPDGGEVAHAGTNPGLDTYQWVNGLNPKSPPSAILAGWNRALHTTNKVRNISSDVITEIGILAQNGAYSEPYAWRLPLKTHPFNQSIQANWFTAACQFYKAHGMRGIYFWVAYLGGAEGMLLTSPDPTQPRLLQPRTQAAIRACFTGR